MVKRYQKQYDQAFRRMSTQQFQSVRDFTLSESDIVNNGVFDHKLYRKVQKGRELIKYFSDLNDDAVVHNGKK